MPYASSLSCNDCQKLLSIGLHALSEPYQVAVQQHLTACPTCRMLHQQYDDMDTLLRQVPEMQPLPDLLLRFQQTQQAHHISELDEKLAPWAEILEEGLSSALLHADLDKAVEPVFSQERQHMKNYPSKSETQYPTPTTSYGQFAVPPDRAPRPRRSLWRTISIIAAVLLVLITILAWSLAPHLLNTVPTASLHSKQGTPTVAPQNKQSTPITKGSLSQPYTDCTLNLPQELPQTISWSSSENLLTLGSLSKLVRPDTCKIGSTYTTETGSTWDANWSPDGKRLASYDGQEVDILDGRTLTILSSYKAYGVTISMSGQSIAPLAMRSGGIGHIYASAWSPSGAQMASLVVKNAPINEAGSSEIQVWETSSGTYLRTLQPAIGMAIEAVTWSPDGRYIAAADGNSRVLVWNAQSGALVYTINHEVTGENLNAFSWSPDGHYLAFSDNDSVQVWNMQNDQPAFSFKGGWQRHSSVSALAWSPDGKYIAAASTDVRLFDAQSHKLVATYTGHQIKNGFITFPPGGGTESSGLDGYIVALAWSPDSTRIASLTNNMMPPPRLSAQLKVWSI